MDVRRPDRSAIGLRVAGSSGDLIEDIHRQQRRRLLKRAAQLVALAITLLLLGLVLKLMADQRERAVALSEASEEFAQGTVATVQRAATLLEESLEQHPGHEGTLGALAVVRAYLWLEFGIEESQARDAVGARESDDEGAIALARAIIAFGDGDIEAAEQGLAATADEDGDFLRGVWVWLSGRVAAAKQDPEVLATAVSEIDAYLEGVPASVAHRRIRSLLLLLGGQHEEALTELEQAREISPSHLGLAADEALYNAYLHQELGGVASVADQLMASHNEGLSPRDRAHVQLARGVVHVRSGEASEGLAMLEEAWPELVSSTEMARELAIQTALEAGDASHFVDWLKLSGLPDAEQDIYRAWGLLVQGDVMASLDQLAGLPQSHPRVGLLQALALVEQLRFAEAAPWLERVDGLLPGRHDVEVARARVELRTGDKVVALRKLEGLAEEEPFAPRAWTGLGEAYLLQEDVDASKARRALEKAVEREPVPAEAMLRLAQWWDGRRMKEAEAERKALDLHERAAKSNPHLPRYREQLALYLADLGHTERAREAMRELVDASGIGWPVLVRLIELEVEAGTDKVDFDALLEQAKELGAPPSILERERARIALDEGSKESVQQAQAILLAVLDQQPADVESRVLYAMTHLKQFDRKAAETAVRRGFSASPESDWGRLHLAWAQIESRTGKGSTAAARARSAWVQMLAEDRPAWELLQAADLATRMWQRQDNHRVALAIAKQLTTRIAFHSDAWTIRARTELGGGDAAAARDAAERAIELDEHNPEARAMLGHALLRFGHKDRAKEAYEKAIELVAGGPLEKEYRENLRRL